MTTPSGQENTYSRTVSPFNAEVIPGGDADSFDDVNQENFGGGTVQWDARGNAFNPYTK